MIDFFQRVDPQKCGGKGKNLVILDKASFPIPPGFVITIEVHKQSQKGEEIHISPENKERISTCYRQLVKDTGSPWVSVRSSASAEDMPNASFAGQYETYLFVQSCDEIIRRTEACWRSLYSERAITYRKLMKIPEKGLSMAVIIQTMINPRSAGIVFTAYNHPQNPDQEVMLLESNWGCGETVVSGQATPDNFLVSPIPPHEILEKTAGAKEVFIQAGPSGAILQQTPEKQKKEFSLTDREVSRLSRLGKKIQHHFGTPQDIEWALDNKGKIHILQSRPLTT